MSRPLIKPRRLAPGDTIGLISPSGPATAAGSTTPESIEVARRHLLGVGFRTVMGPHALDARGYLAGTDADRAADLQAMFADPGVQGILCVRGGYGAHRLLDALDYDLIRRHPKVFVGYSDITALHCAFHTQAGVVSFHGPMAGVLAGGDEADQHDLIALLRAVTRAEPIGPLANPPGGPQIATLVPGVAEGELIGGNAALVTALLGTPYQPDFAGKILFLEDLGDHVYRLDRKIAHLRLAGVLHRVAGVVVGECRYTPDPEPPLTLRQILDDLVVPIGKPAIYGLACGHGAYHLTLPVGVRARLDATRGILSVEEAAVTE
ncbi:MAG TPA: LD-carboxypeptidase [bacterium]|nr:LD-carboxypeptidase [bacterium]